MNSKVKSKEALQKVKTALAEKYERLARLTSSKPKQRELHQRALKYRRQAAQLGHQP